MHHHKRILLLLAAVVRTLSALLLLATSRLPSFDTSAEVVLGKSWYTPLLRWDVFHFAHIAEHGYVYEYEWAFYPGLPILLRYTSKLLGSAWNSSDGHQQLLLAGALVAMCADSTLTLYALTEQLFHSRSFAFLASLLSLLPSSPATLRHAAYMEPIFTYLSYKGMLFTTRKQWVRASLSFALASAFRSNGALLPIYLVWYMLFQPFLQSRELPRLSRVSYCCILSFLPLLPTLAHHYAAYHIFCDSDVPATWCTNFPPSIYTHVQSTYWNVGLFRYWTLQQLPNILLAAPVLSLLFYGSLLHLRYGMLPRVVGAQLRPPPKSPFFDLSVTPFAIHSLFLAITLLIASHTQIALRLASALPFLYWCAAYLWTVGKPHGQGPSKYARWWTGWSVVWGAVSLVLWGVFLPPA